MESIIAKLLADYPALRFTAADQFYWSPETGEICYDDSATGRRAVWSLLHETGHALLGHTSYRGDFELLQLEIAAWERAKDLAGDLRLTIKDDHIQASLDTYRDWLHKRSICPDCGTKALQQGDFVHYRCFNCHKVWKVGPNRFARAYRRHSGIARTDAILF
jgi:hypothetical protein